MRHLILVGLILSVVTLSGCRNNGWFRCDGYLDPGYCSPSNPMSMPQSNMVPVQARPAVGQDPIMLHNGQPATTPTQGMVNPTPLQGQTSLNNQGFGTQNAQTGGQIFQGAFVQ